MSQPTLEDAVRLAVEGHRGQTDRYGQPTILHALRVMFRLQRETDRIVGVLHDLIEDTEYTLDDLRGLGYPQEIVEALDGVTRREGESYEAFVQRSKANAMSARVKLADLEDNMDVRRMSAVSPADTERLARYRRAWQEIQG